MAADVKPDLAPDVEPLVRSWLRAELARPLVELQSLDLPGPPDRPGPPELLERLERDPAAVLAAVRDALSPATELGLVAAPTCTFGPDGRPRVAISAGGDPASSRVGLVELWPGLVLRVVPKIACADWLGLLSLARGWGDVAIGDGSPAAGHDDIVELLVQAYLAALIRLGRLGGLRRAYDPRDEILRGRVRGRLDVTGWVRQLAAGRPDRAPCHYAPHDLDSFHNRVLLRAFRLGRGLLAALPTSSRGATPAGIEPLFAGVTDDVGLGPADVQRPPRLPRSQRLYETSLAWPLACLILRHAFPGREDGRRPGVAFSLNMPDVFEDALRAGLGGVAEKWKYRVESAEPGGLAKEKELKPDVMATVAFGEAASVRVIADAKYKAVLNGRLSVEERDVYQVMAYAAWDRANSVTTKSLAILVYPVVGPGAPLVTLDDSSATCITLPGGESRYHRVRLGPTAKAETVCWLGAWDIGTQVDSASPRTLRDRLLNLVRAIARAEDLLTS